MAGDLTTIARPYAEAVFALARERDRLKPWSDALALLSHIVVDPLATAQLGNPHLSRERLAELILGIAGDALDSDAVGLVKLLAVNRRLAALPEIARLFEERHIAEQGIRHVLVRSALPLAEGERQDLIAALKRRFGAEVELQVEEDPDLIGGVEVRADDLVIDGSIRGRLQQLSNELQF